MLGAAASCPAHHVQWREDNHATHAPPACQPPKHANRMETATHPSPCPGLAQLPAVQPDRTCTASRHPPPRRHRMLRSCSTRGGGERGGWAVWRYWQIIVRALIHRPSDPTLSQAQAPWLVLRCGKCAATQHAAAQGGAVTPPGRSPLKSFHPATQTAIRLGSTRPHPARMPATMKASFRVISSPLTLAGLVSANANWGRGGSVTRLARLSVAAAGRPVPLLCRPGQRARHAFAPTPPSRLLPLPTCYVGWGSVHGQPNAQAIDQPRRQHRRQVGSKGHQQGGGTCSQRG